MLCDESLHFLDFLSFWTFLNMKVELMEAWIHLFLKHIAINFKSDQLMKDKFISDQLLFEAGLAKNSME